MRWLYATSIRVRAGRGWIERETCRGKSRVRENVWVGACIGMYPILTRRVAGRVFNEFNYVFFGLSYIDDSMLLSVSCVDATLPLDP